MNKLDRERLVRFQQLLLSIPFPQDGSGTKTASLIGLVGYQSDMRNFLPVLKKVLESMILEGRGDMEEGWDYENADKLMDTLEAWIAKRKRESWENVSEYDFSVFKKQIQHS